VDEGHGGLAAGGDGNSDGLRWCPARDTRCCFAITSLRPFDSL
jgi:hypothetical protein